MVYCFYRRHFQDTWNNLLLLMANTFHLLQRVMNLAALFWSYCYWCSMQIVLHSRKDIQLSSLRIQSWMKLRWYRQQTQVLLTYTWWSILFLSACCQLFSSWPSLLPQGIAKVTCRILVLLHLGCLISCLIVCHQSRRMWSYCRRF